MFCVFFQYTIASNTPTIHTRKAAVPRQRDASSMVAAGATANTTEGNSRASRESGLLCSHSHGESIGRPTCRGAHCDSFFSFAHDRQPHTDYTQTEGALAEALIVILSFRLHTIASNTPTKTHTEGILAEALIMILSFRLHTTASNTPSTHRHKETQP